MTLPTLGKIALPHLSATGETFDFTSDCPDSISPVSPQYPKCPLCSSPVYATQRTLRPPDGAFCGEVVPLFDECGTCGWRKAI